MDNIFKIKRNDTLPLLTLQVTTKNCIGSVIPYSLTASTAVTFTMVDDCGNFKISSASATILTASAGTIQYAWSGTDTDTSGRYEGEFEIFFSGGTGNKLSIPTVGSISINILDDINNT